ncbi:MAG: hypothetical protein ACLGQX_08960 [Acidobacteriota bacterium]
MTIITGNLPPGMPIYTVRGSNTLVNTLHSENQSTRTEEIEGLKTLVVRRALYWSTAPEYIYGLNGKYHSGTEVELAGTIPDKGPFVPFDPDEAVQLFRDLLLIADWVVAALPKERVDIMRHRTNTYFSAKHHNRPDAIVTVRLRTHDLANDDDRAQKYLSAIEERLSDLGAERL